MLLNSFAKRLVDLFVVMVHTGEEVGVRTYKATRHLTRRRVQAQKNFANKTNKPRTKSAQGHAQTTNKTAQGHDASHDENNLKPPRRPRPRGGKHKEWYAQLYRSVWKR